MRPLIKTAMEEPHKCGANMSINIGKSIVRRGGHANKTKSISGSNHDGKFAWSHPQLAREICETILRILNEAFGKKNGIEARFICAADSIFSQDRKELLVQLHGFGFLLVLSLRKRRFVAIVMYVEQFLSSLRMWPRLGRELCVLCRKVTL